MDEVKEPILDYNLLDLDGTYTYSDYMRWLFKERVELIKGKIVKMSPGPNRVHQDLNFTLTGLFYNLFHKQPCKVYAAPFDVVLPVPSAKKDSTIVQPDLCVICDLTKLDGQGCKGSPDLIIEILSLGNSKHDMQVKFNLYEESGVKEYWIVDPVNRSVLLFVLINNKYVGLHPFLEGNAIESALFPDIKITVDQIFERVE
ncbi:MAG: Uma2 family endonuclease [Bacteroidota bacterium]